LFDIFYIKNCLAIAAVAAIVISCGREESSEEDSLSPFDVQVYEFLPAPGQFVNSGYDALDQASACNWAEDQLNNDGLVSLGAFGGYIVVGFDHSIKNSGGYDFGIKSNQTESSSEPGIVYVSRDENSNGKPDDIWYEIKGSLYDDPETIHGYQVTYYCADENGNYPWKDNRGKESYVPSNRYHQQSYYPAWVKEQSYTLSGTLLKARNYDKSGAGNMWINPTYGSGYVDNWDPDNTLDGYTLFSISDAVDEKGSYVNLGKIDFIKVQTAVQAVSGWLGEASTEVCGFMDYHMYLEKAE